jgi:hypothetical protein
MTLPQSGRLDGSEQPQGLPDARAQRLFEVTVFIPALGVELLLFAAKSLHTRFIHLMYKTPCYYTLPCAASVPMLCGSI